MPPPPVSNPFCDANSQILWVRGTNEENLNLKTHFKNIEIHNLLISEELEIKINQSKIILSRSGYSSLMDWAALGISQIILIPTPGQTEQEYLATYFSNQRFCFSAAQSHFRLAHALSQVANFKGFSDFNFASDVILKVKIRQILEKKRKNESH